MMKINKKFLIWGAACAVFLLFIGRFFITSTHVADQTATLILVSGKIIPSPGYRIPVNTFPAYGEIDEAIKKDNARREMAKAMAEDQKKKIAMVSASTLISTGDNAQFFNNEPDSATDNKATTIIKRRYEPTAEEIKDFQDKGYVIQ